MVLLILWLEYETYEGLWDPMSGGFVAVCGALSSMAMGLGDGPDQSRVSMRREPASGKQYDIM